jgi:fructuronate reductase
VTQDLSRRDGDGRAVAPVRHVHLGLGNFFRAHQAFYTEHAPDHDDWGIAAFTGRSAELATVLNAQENLYTLLTRGPEDDRYDVISSLSATYPATAHDRFLRYLASAETRLLTLTVTEAGYRRNAAGGLDLDLDSPDIQADLTTLRAALTQPTRTVPARITAGLAARRASGVGPISVVPCDNLPDNGATVARIIAAFAERLDPALAAWIEESVSFVSTVVDRITPRPDPSVRSEVAAATGRDDRSPVLTEPFSEWVISGSFPGGRPGWEHAGAILTDVIGPYENRKLWLLNGGHSLLAYAGSLRGHDTVAAAVADETCRVWLEEWWQEAAAHLALPVEEVTTYRASVLARYANSRLDHRLEQIAADGSQKLPIRVLPVLRAERALGRLPPGAIRILAGWLCHLRGHGVAVHDAAAVTMTDRASGPLTHAARRVVSSLDKELGEDDEIVEAVAATAQELVPTL